MRALRTLVRTRAQAVRVAAWWRATRRDHLWVSRLGAHVAVLGLVGLALFGPEVYIPWRQGLATATGLQGWQEVRLFPTSLSHQDRSDEEGYLVRAVVPHTTVGGDETGLGGIAQGLDDERLFRSRELRVIPGVKRTGIITYTVQAGDTVYGIAERFGITPNTILWSNDKLEDNPDLLYIGQELIILPVSGVYHTVQEGDTLEKIAKQYKVDVSAITQFKLNHVSSDEDLRVGQKLVVPGGRKPYIPRVVTATYTAPIPADAAKGTGVFGWPVSGRITQKYWERHRGLDIAAAKGSPVYAADSGFVVYAGWSDVGYGYMVLIDHGNGFRTLYAHLSWFYVEKGQSVAKGQKIGLVGSTGRSTGSHLHFELIQNGVKRNPIGFLP